MNKPLRVLIIEDVEDDALLLVNYLRKGGFDPGYERVETSDDMSKALDRQTWDIILADYVMPKFDGLAAFKLMKQRKLDIPFILISGSIAESIALETMKAGTSDYIMKDNLARLIPALERELQESKVRQIRQQVEEQNRILLRAVEHAPVSILITDPEGKIQYVNPQFNKTYGYTSDDVIGETPRILKSGDQSQEFYKQLWNIITSGNDWQGRFRNKKKCGELF